MHYYAKVACLKTDTLGQALAPTAEAGGVPALPLPNGETAGRLLAPAWQRHEPSPSAPPLKRRRSTGQDGEGYQSFFCANSSCLPCQSQQKPS